MERIEAMGNGNDCWGGEDKYYASTLLADQHENSLWDTETDKIRHLLKYKDAMLESRVKKTCKDWNQAIRSAIREETGLKSFGKTGQSGVTVKVIDGYPKQLWEITQNIDRTILWLLVNKQQLEYTSEGLNILLNDSLFICDMLNQDHTLNHNALDISSKLNAMLLKELEKWKVLEKLKEIDEDIFGAYFYRIPEIRMYWMAISLFSFFIGVSVEALTFVVLTHELAHAYHHLGLDTDDEYWNTNHFGNTSRYTVEGLAQYFTGVICHKMSNKFFDAGIAFDKLLEHQAGPYVNYVEWTKDLKQPGEVIRAAMIDVRRKGIHKYGDYKECLDIHKKRFLK